MDTNLAFLGFCITVIAVVAIAHNNHRITEKAIETLAKLTNGGLRFNRNLKEEDKQQE